jgi:hypothetical protein
VGRFFEMKVLVDYHHGNLYHSLQLLFEKRLGFEMYRPIGLEWFTNGYFKIAEPYGNAQDTIDQYLDINNRGWDTHKNLNGDYKIEDGIYHIYDPENKIHHKAITFDKFKEIEFDYILASFPTHGNWENLLRYQPKAKFIMQIGNEGQTSQSKNILCSTADFVAKPEQNFYQYHQEFDLGEFEYEPPKHTKKIKSFVISLPEPNLYFAYKNALPEFDFKSHGVGSPDGTVHGPLIPQMMRESMFGYHVKPADGYGHVIHKWMASGRPVIVRGNYYKGKMAEPLLIDGVTCIDLDKHSFEENIALIRKYSQPEEHKRMCENAYKRFHEVVNFDKEAQEIKEWLTII